MNITVRISSYFYEESIQNFLFFQILFLRDLFLDKAGKIKLPFNMVAWVMDYYRKNYSSL